jgi:hypothetical protein
MGDKGGVWKMDSPTDLSKRNRGNKIQEYHLNLTSKNPINPSRSKMKAIRGG